MSDIFKIDIKSSNKYLKNYKKIYFFASKIKFIFIFYNNFIITNYNHRNFYFFLINKKKIFKNYLILPFYNWTLNR